MIIDQPNFIQYKGNLIDTDLLDYYHIMHLCSYYDNDYSEVYRTRPVLWPAYLMWHGPFLVHPAFANEKACMYLHHIMKCSGAAFPMKAHIISILTMSSVSFKVAFSPITSLKC